MTVQKRLSELIHSPRQRMLAVNLVILVGGEAFSRLITAIAFVHLARVLEPALYGHLELTLAVMMFLTLVVDQGLGTVGAREVARQPASAAQLLRRIVSTQIVLAGLTFVLLVVGVLLLPLSRTLTLLLVGYGTSLLLYPLVFYWLFQGQDKMVWVALPQVIRQTAFAAFALLIVREPGQLLLLPVAELAAVGIAAIISLVVFKRAGRKVSLNLRRDFDWRLIRESFPIGGSQLIWALRMYLPTILVGALVGQAAVGFFGAAHRIVMVLQTMLEAYFRNLFPTMSQAAAASAERLTRLLRNSMWLLMVPSLLAAAGTTLIAPTLIQAIFGEQYVRPEAVQVLAVLMWMIPVLAWRRHGRNALITMNFQREEWYCSLAGVVLLLASVVPLTHTYGGLGTALAMVGSELFAAALAWWRMVRRLPKLKSRRPGIQSTGPDREIGTAPRRPQGLDDASPIFILGAPRSGTSLLRVMLNRHPAIGICDETYYFYYVYTRRNAFGDLADPVARGRLVARYLDTHRIKKLDLNQSALVKRLMCKGDSYASFFLTLMQFYAESQGKSRYGEKTPQHALYAETLCEWYPNAKLIHLVRDPRDVVASLLRMPWASKSTLANARIWLTHTLAAERCRRRDNTLLVHYERLISAPEEELQRICTFLGEDYSETMLQASASSSADEWWFQRAHEPLTTERLGVWRRHLTPTQVAIIEWVAGSHMQGLGYEPSRQPASIPARAMALSEEFVDTLRRKLLMLPRTWYFWLRPTHLAKEEGWIDSRA